MNGVHRAAFLDEMVKLVTNENLAHFAKRWVDLEDTEDGKKLMKFKDGTTATADAVIGCDGLKCVVRRIIAGRKVLLQPTLTPTNTLTAVLST
jgi:salicylate hydroxylase